MISRGSSDASQRFRRVKSSSSVRLSPHMSSESKGIDPETAHQQALTAASLAFERASERVIATQGVEEHNPSKGVSPSHGAGDRQRLERKQSVRFTGPTAIPYRNRSITRRTAPGNVVSYGSPKGQRERQQAHKDLSFTQSEGYEEALYRNEDFVGTRVSSLPTSYRRLRKARSMFSPRNIKPVIFTNGTPQKSSRARRQLHGLQGNEEQEYKILNHRVRRSYSFLRGESDRLTSSATPRLSQDEAIQFARDEYLRQLEEQRLKEKRSFLALGKKAKAQKAFRKTVRTGSSNSYGSAIESPMAVSADLNIKKGFGHKARSLSLSLKNKLKKVFYRTADVEEVLPTQQIDATRPYFGDYMSTSSGVDQQYHHIPSPDSETLQRSMSRESPLRNTAVFVAKAASPGSIRSAQSDDEISNGKSRVTSWTNSTAANTMTSNQLLDKKRLSVIQEHGGPYQPSNTIRNYGNLGEIFRQPIKNDAIGAQKRGDPDSHRVYSALQRKLFDNKRLALQEENGLDDEGNTNEEGPHIPKRHPGPRMITNTSTNDFASHQSTKVSNSIVFSSSKNDTVDNKAFQPSNENLSVRKRPLEVFDLHSELTPQQIAEHNESSNSPIRRPLREVKSAFFPSSMRFERSFTSPYKKAMNASSEDRAETELETEESIRQMNGFTSIYRPLSDKGRSRSLVGSASIYSRTSSGNTPKQNKSTLSLAKSDGSEEPGTAVIITTKPKKYDRSLISSMHQSNSSTHPSGDWKKWMASEVAPLENRGIENMRTADFNLVRKTGHMRELTQIDGDDVQIGWKKTNIETPNQPLGIILGNQTSHPFSRHQMSRSINNRHPLMEIGHTTTLRNLEHDFHTPVPYPTMPSNGLSPTTHQRGTSNGKNNLSGGLGSQASPHSFESVHVSSLRKQRSAMDLGSSPADNQERKSRTRPEGIIQAKQKLYDRGSPERVARLRRMLSSNAIASEDLNEFDPTRLIESYQNKRNPESAKSTTTIASEGYQRSDVEAGLPWSTTNETQVGANRKLVDIFLSNRRKDMRISEENGGDPAFL